MTEHRQALAGRAGRLLAKQGKTLAVAESCTGGMLGAALTAVPGSSRFFLGGVIAYADEVKQRMLGVEAKVLAAEGAVSEAVARAMARGVRQRFRAAVGIGITGIAGPGGGTAGKPVGLVFIGVADVEGCKVSRYRFEGGRHRVRVSSCRAALAMLKECLDIQGDDHGKKE